MYKITFCLIFMLSFIGCGGRYEVTPQRLDDIKNTSKILDLNTGKEINFDDFVAEVLDADILLVGELHDDFRHHLAEILLIETLSKYKNLDVAFEMLGSDKQKYVDNIDRNISSNDLIKAVKWDKSWDKKYYRGVLEAAFYKAHIKCANLSDDEIRLIFGGAQPIKGTVSTAKNVQDAIAKLVSGAHSAADDQTLRKLVQAQQYKDRRMADVVNKSANLAILIAGRYHVQKDVGVPLHLIDFKTKKRFKTLLLGFKGDYAGIKEADYIWKFK